MENNTFYRSYSEETLHSYISCLSKLFDRIMKNEVAKAEWLNTLIIQASVSNKEAWPP